MYDIRDVLATIDHHTAYVLYFTACAWLLGAAQFIEGLRLTWRDKVIGLPLGYICIVFAHDSYFAVHYDFFLHHVHHWYYSLSTCLMAPFPLIEVVVIVWLVRIARREIAPTIPALGFYSIYLVFQATALTMYWLLQSWIDDPLRVTGFWVANVINILFMIPMALRRGSTKGQSRLMAWILLVGPASQCLFLTTALVPSLLTPYYWAAAACTTILALTYLLLFEYYRRQEALARMAS